MDHRGIEASLGKRLRKEFQPTVHGATVEVTFDCDPLTSPLRELTIETGSGHGGSLVLWRVFRHTYGKDFHLFGLTHADPWQQYDLYTYEVANRFDVQLVRDRLEAEQVEKVAALAATALTARFRQIEPPSSVTTGFEGFLSSADTHLFVRMVDESGHVLERRFTGYEGTSGQATRLGLELAMTSLVPLLDNHGFEKLSPTDDEREWFVEQYLDAQPRLHEGSSWWVGRRYLRMAGRIGTIAVVPALLGELEARLSEIAESRDPGDSIWELADPILALANVTGWDARLDADGHLRPMDEVAREYLAECRRALAPTQLGPEDPGEPAHRAGKGASRRRFHRDTAGIPVAMSR
ncbi:MAG: hypothetical protein JW751_00225 [Polyangiaceae bacterium]|nr:hypothetical protein [Polyangiaceae bacterium]